MKRRDIGPERTYTSAGVTERYRIGTVWEERDKRTVGLSVGGFYPENAADGLTSAELREMARDLLVVADLLDVGGAL
jgi:hypothetical protein